MAQRFEEAKERIFDNVYICIRCGARNRTENPEDTTCRKCDYAHLRKKNEQRAG